MKCAPVSPLLVCFVLGACGDEPDGGLDTWMGEPTTSLGTTETSGNPETESGTSDETDTGETDAGADDPFDGLRFVASSSNSAVILAMDLDDPASVAGPEYISTGDGMAGMFGPTPWGAQAVVHAGVVDQLRFDGLGDPVLARLIMQDSPWIENLWFSADGANALATSSAGPLTNPNTLLWMTYDEDGGLTGSFDITPPLQAQGAIYVPGRSPDSSHAAIIIDAEPDGIWEIYLLPLVDGPGLAELIDQIDLTGISPIAVPAFLSLHIDDQRIAYRREVNPDVWRPVAVPLDDPESNPVNLVVGFEHTYSVVWSADAQRMLFTKGGETGHRELVMADLNGPVDANQAITLSEPGELALLDSLPPLDREAPGHGFDAMGRIWYGHQIAPSLDTVAISLLTVPFNGGLSDRALLSDTPPGAVIDEIIWDADTQLLGYRTDSGDQSWVSYIDLSADQPLAIRLDQDFEYFADEPERNASFGWSATGGKIAVAGVQGAGSVLHVAEAGEPGGTTLEIELPDVSGSPGARINHRPMLSPDGDQVVLWYGIPSGLRGLIHAPTDGSAPAADVLMIQHALTAGAFVPHTPSN